MKFKRLVSVLTVCFLLSTQVYAGAYSVLQKNISVYSDLQTGAPYEDAIMYLSQKGILLGFDDNTFRPSHYVTRAEFCKIMVEAFPDKLEQKNAITFSDIDKHWAKDYIITAFSLGLVNGFEDGTFLPDENMTYEQAITVAVRTEATLSGAYPISYLGYALEQGISDHVSVVTGKYITRGEIAQIIYNLLMKQDFKKQEAETLVLITPSEYQDSATGGALLAPTSPNAAPMATVSPAPAPSGNTGGGMSGNANSGYYAPPINNVDADYYNNQNAEEYNINTENRFKSPAESPFSTFSLDVDTASYSMVRRMLASGKLPDKGAVRAEEIINYFSYDLERPNASEPFSVTTEVQPCPWNSENYLAMIALQGYDIDENALPPSNLVFLIDVSGSMFSANRLPLVQRSLAMLTDEKLTAQDKVTIVTYSGSSGVALEPTSGADKDAIKSAIYALKAGGSTNGAGGITRAYEEAEKSFIQGGNNRVIICTDGDFNVGISSATALEDLITEKRKSGIFLSVLGYGMGNYKDNKLETLAQCGNGNYAYIDNIKEAKKVLLDDMTSTIFTIAKDVKLQVEFNPETVESYRLIGYENRMLNTEDFADDQKDAGEMGAGHSMIAFYEIVPNTSGDTVVSESKYQTSQSSGSTELMNIDLRYKLPDGDSSILMESTAVLGLAGNTASETFRFASAAAEFALVLEDSEHKGNANLDSVLERALNSVGGDQFGYRAEFIQLIGLAKLLYK